MKKVTYVNFCGQVFVFVFVFCICFLYFVFVFVISTVFLPLPLPPNKIQRPLWMAYSSLFGFGFGFVSVSVSVFFPIVYQTCWSSLQVYFRLSGRDKDSYISQLNRRGLKIRLHNQRFPCSWFFFLVCVLLTVWNIIIMKIIPNSRPRLSRDILFAAPGLQLLQLLLLLLQDLSASCQIVL